MGHPLAGGQHLPLYLVAGEQVRPAQNPLQGQQQLPQIHVRVRLARGQPGQGGGGGKGVPLHAGQCVHVLRRFLETFVLLEAADQLADIGLDAEVLDLRSLRPLDEEAIYATVRKTNRAVVIDEAWPIASVGSHVGWMISKNCFDDLDAPVELVHSEDVPMPYNHTLELAAQPSVEKIVQAAKRVSYKE